MDIQEIVLFEANIMLPSAPLGSTQQLRGALAALCLLRTTPFLVYTEEDDCRLIHLANLSTGHSKTLLLNCHIHQCFLTKCQWHMPTRVGMLANICGCV